MIRPIALLLTLLTGFAGLVYEVTWQRYLATLLGSHSEATAAVLGIFLGGLSVGYWLFGALTRRLVDRAAALGRPPRLLLFYGTVEAGIGIRHRRRKMRDGVRQRSLGLDAPQAPAQIPVAMNGNEGTARPLQRASTLGAGRRLPPDTRLERASRKHHQPLSILRANHGKS